MFESAASVCPHVAEAGAGAEVTALARLSHRNRCVLFCWRCMLSVCHCTVACPCPVFKYHDIPYLCFLLFSSLHTVQGGARCKWAESTEVRTVSKSVLETQGKLKVVLFTESCQDH